MLVLFTVAILAQVRLMKVSLSPTFQARRCPKCGRCAQREPQNKYLMSCVNCSVYWCGKCIKDKIEQALFRLDVRYFTTMKEYVDHSFVCNMRYIGHNGMFECDSSSDEESVGKESDEESDGEESVGKESSQ
jgi:hypothetical protein